jgi:large subunit ribosomal protein L30
MATQKTISVKLIKSTIGRLEAHKACIRGLGLKKIHQTVTVIDTPSNRGMINKVSYLLQVAA